VDKNQDESIGLLAQQLAQACIENLNDNCTCSIEYKNIKRKDPACEYCNVGEFILYLAHKIKVNVPVKFHIDWNNEPEVETIIDNEDQILIGNDIPPERHDSDYKSLFHLLFW
jgi:hypothetical protein